MSQALNGVALAVKLPHGWFWDKYLRWMFEPNRHNTVVKFCLDIHYLM